MWRSEDFYFDSMAQIAMDTWSAGRVTLVGDAGSCASPLSGQGTSLALVGAYLLASELGRNDDHASAFDRYESRMRPFAAANQELAVKNRGEMDPEQMAARTDAVKDVIDLDLAG